METVSQMEISCVINTYPNMEDVTFEEDVTQGECEKSEQVFISNNSRFSKCLQDGCKPVVNPLERFPLEIWAKIFAHPHKLQDLKNVANASPHMYHALPSEVKCTVLLPQVLRFLLQPKLKKTLKYTKYGKPVISTQKHYPYLSRQDLYKLRRVSEAWDEAIKEYLQHHTNHIRLEDSPRYEYRLCGDTTTEYGFNSFAFPAKKNQFEYCSMTKRFIYPTPSKSTTIVITDPIHLMASNRTDRIRSYWTEVEYILKENGKNMWHCKIIVSTPTSMELQYRRLIKFLRLMPNLKVLEILNGANTKMDTASNDTNEIVSKMPCPTLANLVLLKVRNVPHLIFNEIIKRNDHLSKLSIERISCASDSFSLSDSYNINPLTNLRELSMSLSKTEDIQILESSQKSTDKPWPLTSLSLHFEGDNHPENYNFFQFPENAWKRIFDCIGKYKETLETLKLKLPRATTPQEKKAILEGTCLSWRLNLNIVKTLRLVLPNACSLDFLLPMRNSLENFKVLVDHCESGYYFPGGENPKEQIKFNGFFSRMHESNLFQRFPFLKGNLDLGVRQNEKTLNLYVRPDFNVYTYAQGHFISTNAYYFE